MVGKTGACHGSKLPMVGNVTSYNATRVRPGGTRDALSLLQKCSRSNRWSGKIGGINRRVEPADSVGFDNSALQNGCDVRAAQWSSENRCRRLPDQPTQRDGSSKMMFSNGWKNQAGRMLYFPMLWIFRFRSSNGWKILRSMTALTCHHFLIPSDYGLLEKEIGK